MMCVGRVCGCERAQTRSLLQSEPGPASCTALLLGAAESRGCAEPGLRKQGLWPAGPREGAVEEAGPGAERVLLGLELGLRSVAGVGVVEWG